jgi:ribonucleoside-triphosphate reductase
MFEKIVKRDGRIVDFDSSKITNAIFKAGQATGEFGMDIAKKLTIKVLDLAMEIIKDKIPTVEEIQDIVEEVLLHSPYKKTAKAYIIYREQHAKIREITTKANLDLINQYLNQIDWRVKENSNMSFSLQGLNNYVSSEIVKTYWLNSIYPPEVRKAYIEGDFHIHDLGSLSVYCVGWDLYDLLLTGFRGAPGKVESSPAKHFRTALGQIVNFFYSLQGEAAGAQAFSNFDTLLAPFVRYDGLSYKDVKQCIQEFLFNLNVPTRVGFQSLDWDELVVIKHKGKIKFVEIGKLVDEKFEKNSHRIIEQHPSSFAVQNYDDYYALSFDSQGKAVWARIKAFIRHKVPKDSKFIKIRTNRGEVKVSPAHSLFAFEKFDSNFNPKPVKPYEVETAKDYRHLNEKNHFLALSKLENNSDKEELDLVELIDEFPQIHKNVFVKINPTRTLSQIKHKIIQEYQAIYPFYIDFGIRDRKVWKEWLKRKAIRYDIWRKFGEQKRETLFKLKNSKIWYPRILKGEILENFVKLSAWYVGEGHKGISVPLFVSQADPENVKEILKILKKLKSLGEIQKNQGYSPKGNKTKIVRKIAGKGLLSEIISLSCGIMAFNKVVPWYIFELSTKYQKIFIQELLKGEAKEYKNHWDLSTTSRKLASSLSLLLAQNNIRFSVYTEKPREKNKNWRNQWIIRVFKEKFPARKEYKVEDFEARVCLGKEEYEYKNEFEYDISVDLPQENFVGGVGLLVFHNTPFTNITLDLKPSPVYKDQPVVIGGKLQNKTYGEFQEEMNMINKAFFEVMQEGDAKGRVFTFPIPTYNITKDFDWNNEILDGLWEMTGKYGIPYFANFINSDMKPEDVRSMCLDANQEILIRNSKKIKRLSIKEVVESYKDGEFDEEGWAECRKEGNLEVLSLNPQTLKMEWVPVKRFLKIKDDKAVEVITEDGKISLFSLKHPVSVYTPEGIKMKFAKDLQKGDYLLTLKRANENIFSNEYQKIEDLVLNEDLAKILGYFVADGNYLFENKKGSTHFGKPRGMQFTFKTGDQKNLEEIKHLIKKLFNATTHEKQDPRYNTYYLYIYNAEIARKIYNAGFKKYGRLPQILFNSPKSVIESFLEFYFKGDGYEKRKEIHLNDLELSRDLVLLFSLVGRPVTYKLRKRSQKIYLQHSKSKIKKGSSWLNNPILAERAPGWMAVSTARVPGLRKSRMVGFDTLEKYNAHTEESLKIKNSDIYLVRVEEIKILRYEELKEFYDIELERNHLFVHSLGQISFNCCRLRLDTRHLQKKGGGLFGANPLTGSIGVVTINLPRIGYLSKSKEEFKSRLNDLLYLAKESLEIKRKVIERLTDENLYPYSKFYLRNVKERFGKYWVNHFSTIGIIGMNEACLNLFGKDIGSREGIEFAKEIMYFIREKLEEFQKETGNIYNLEATPAEGTSYRLARIDKNKFPDIIVANEEEYRKGAEPFYTNSTHLPVNYTDDIFEVLEKQDQLQTLYTGGTVIHIFVGEKIDSKEGIKKLVKTICENFRLPYFTITPTFSVCSSDGYISGEHFTCPKCGSITEVYSRIVGYLRPVSQWNKGKYEEFKMRKTYVLK